MKIIPVEEIPKRRFPAHRATVSLKPIRLYLKEFMKMGVKHARLDINDGDYKDGRSAYHTIWSAATEHSYPIDVIRRGDDIYLSRRDI